jgi:hypothetical protein
MDQLTNFVGFSSDEHVLMVDNNETLKRLAAVSTDGTARIALWGALPEGRSPESVIALRLSDDKGHRTTLPDNITELQFLQYLSVPRHLAKNIATEAIPRSVATLAIETPGAVEIPEGRVLDHIVRLLAKGPIVFSPHTFPSLQALTTELDRAHRELKVLLSLQHLRALSIGPISTTSVLQALPGHLQVLHLSRGHLSTLSGIDRFVDLTVLTLHSLPKLSDISAIATLKHIEEISILHCPALNEIDELLRVPSLRRALFFRCKDRHGALASVAEKLRANGVDTTVY